MDAAVGFVGSLNMIDTSDDKRSNRRRGLRWVDELCEVHGPVVHRAVRHRLRLTSAVQ